MPSKKTVENNKPASDDLVYDSYFFQCKRKSKRLLRTCIGLAKNDLVYTLLSKAVYCVDIVCLLLRIPRPFSYAAEIFVCNEHRFICLAIPLCGTHVLRRFFRLNFGSKVRVVKQPISVLLEETPEYADYFKFTFIRNPWARAVSGYNKKILNRRSSISTIPILARSKGLKAEIDFEGFVHWLASPNGSDACADKHWVCQNRLLETEKHIKWDFIGRLESFETDLETAMQLMKLDQKTQLVSRGESGFEMQATAQHKKHQKYYTQDTAALIHNRYSEFIEWSGYTFEGISFDTRPDKKAD